MKKIKIMGQINCSRQFYIGVSLIVISMLFYSCGGKKGSAKNPISAPTDGVALKKEISINLENNENNIQAMRFDVVVPEGSSLEQVVKGDILKDFSCVVGKNKKTVLCYTTDSSKAVPKGTSGELVRLVVKISNSGNDEGKIIVTNLETSSTDYKKNKKQEVGRISYKFASSGAFKDIVIEPTKINITM